MGILEVRDLCVHYQGGSNIIKAVSNVSFSLQKGEKLGIIGESGSGKTSLVLALMGLIGKFGEVKGKAYFQGQEYLSFKDSQMRSLRWKHIAMVFQNSLEILNPVLSIEEQVIEPLKKHYNLRKSELDTRIDELLNLVGLDPCWKEAYPHQLSGGMRQRVLLAMALSCDPDLLLVDEPTASLDPIAKKEIINLLEKLQKEKGFTMILISHDLASVARLTSRVLVLYNSGVLEQGSSLSVMENPGHPYTRGLINSSPGFFAYKDLWGIPGEPPAGDVEGCSFYPRCSQSLESCRENKPLSQDVNPGRRVACNRGGIVTLLKGSGLGKEFKLKKRLVKAVSGVDLRIKEGEVVALVGETGSGKSTLAHMLGNLSKPSSGEISFRGQKAAEDVTRREEGIQIVMQDPFSSTSHRLTVEQTLREPLDINKIGTKEDRQGRVVDVLERVQLPAGKDFLRRYCYELSGGQRQRVAVARALVMKPALLLADEITSMLDPSTQANLMRLLKGLQNSSGFAMLYITHDMDLARKVADRLLVMHQGKIVEEGASFRIFTNPCCCHTKNLLEAAFGQEYPSNHDHHHVV